MRVHVIGPNLRDPAGYDFHVHAEGCSDVSRSALYRARDHEYDRTHAVDVDSRRAVVADYIYPDILAEDPDATWESYEDTVRFYGCVDDLPREA